MNLKGICAVLWSSGWQKPVDRTVEGRDSAVNLRGLLIQHSGGNRIGLNRYQAGQASDGKGAEQTEQRHPPQGIGKPLGYPPKEGAQQQNQGDDIAGNKAHVQNPKENFVHHTFSPS